MSAKVLVSTEDMPYADWLEYRRQGIGGSDASVVCGISRYRSPVELWLDKTGQLPPQEAGEAAYWGTQLEPFVRAEFTKRTGIESLQHESFSSQGLFTQIKLCYNERMKLQKEQYEQIAECFPK